MLDLKDKEFIKELISPLYIEIGEMKVEMKEMRADINELKAGVAVLKEDVAELKADVAELKEEVAELKIDVSKLKWQVSELQINYNNMQDQIIRLETRVRHTNIIIENDIYSKLGFLSEGHEFLKDKMENVLNIVDEHRLWVRVSMY